MPIDLTGTLRSVLKKLNLKKGRIERQISASKVRHAPPTNWEVTQGGFASAESLVGGG